jgi:hypothetical protein
VLFREDDAIPAPAFVTLSLYHQGVVECRSAVVTGLVVAVVLGQLAISLFPVPCVSLVCVEQEGLPR